MSDAPDPRPSSSMPPVSGFVLSLAVLLVGTILLAAGAIALNLVVAKHERTSSAIEFPVCSASSTSTESLPS